MRIKKGLDFILLGFAGALLTSCTSTTTIEFIDAKSVRVDRADAVFYTGPPSGVIVDAYEVKIRSHDNIREWREKNARELYINVFDCHDQGGANESAAPKQTTPNIVYGAPIAREPIGTTNSDIWLFHIIRDDPTAQRLFERSDSLCAQIDVTSMMRFRLVTNVIELHLPTD